MKRRTFTKEKKLAILKQAEEQGVTATLEEHGIYPATYYSWKRKYQQMGRQGFEHGMTPKHLKRIRELEKENKHLKELLIKRELEGKLKGDLLEKKFALERKKRL